MNPSTRQPSQALADFSQALADSLAQQRFVRLVLGNYRGSEPGLQRINVREISLRGERQLSLLYRHATRDVTRNLPLQQAVAALMALLDSPTQPGFSHAHLDTRSEQLDLRISRKGKPGLSRQRVKAAETDHAADTPADMAADADTAAADDDTSASPTPASHDRSKHRLLSLGSPCWQDLGVTDAQGRLIPAMSRKWKQINKFVEVLDAAWRESALSQRPAEAAPVKVMDFGAGKGYLTFGVHAHLSGKLGVASEISGIELREDMVSLCNAVAQRHHLAGLQFVQGDVMQQATGPLDIMIALHACDTATDHALHKGILAGAQIILSSPCCHKQLRPQLRSPGLLRPMLQHGIHLGQQAEMITDSLRALLLEAHGYHTQVFEFVALEHTSKNKMILAVKRRQPARGDAAAQAIHAQIREIKDFYGVREHCLELLLSGALSPDQAGTEGGGASPAR